MARIHSIAALGREVCVSGFGVAAVQIPLISLMAFAVFRHCLYKEETNKILTTFILTKNNTYNAKLYWERKSNSGPSTPSHGIYKLPTAKYGSSFPAQPMQIFIPKICRVSHQNIHLPIKPKEKETQVTFYVPLTSQDQAGTLLQVLSHLLSSKLLFWYNLPLSLLYEYFLNCRVLH